MLDFKLVDERKFAIMNLSMKFDEEDFINVISPQAKTLLDLRNKYLNEIETKTVSIKTGNKFVPVDIGNIDVAEFIKQDTFNNVSRFSKNKDYLISDILFYHEQQRSVEDMVDNVTGFNSYLSKMDIPFLYVQAPDKVSPEEKELTGGVNNLGNTIATELVKSLESKSVNVLDLRSDMVQNNEYYNDAFYNTDAHWTSRTAFKANVSICNQISKLTDIQFNNDMLDLSNYNVTTYEKIFLGNYGKNTGVLFAEPDDFDLIEPKFDTNFNFDCDAINYHKSGSLRESMLFAKHFKWNYYDFNPYAVYNLVGHKHTRITNNLHYNDKKILFINDCAANPIANFIAPHFKETHFFDLRGKLTKEDLFSTIEAVKPDIVVALYFPYFVCKSAETFDINPN